MPPRASRLSCRRIALDREVSTRHLDGWLDYFSADGRMFPDGGNAIQGKAAIGDLMRPLLNDPTASLRWEPIGGDVSASGDLGYTFGHSVVKRSEGKNEDYFGKYVTIWKKQSGGDWKVVLDIGNSRPRP